MKSLIVQQPYIKDPEFYSPLHVMKSAAGYYIGTSYLDPDYGFSEPGTRDSEYFFTKEEASEVLKSWENDYEKFEREARHHP